MHKWLSHIFTKAATGPVKLGKYIRKNLLERWQRCKNDMEKRKREEQAAMKRNNYYGASGGSSDVPALIAAACAGI